MRLSTVATPRHWPQRLKLTMMRRLMGREPPDVVKTLLHRPELVGSALSVVTQRLLRGPSPWGIGERELFAAFVSRLNQCLF